MQVTTPSTENKPNHLLDLPAEIRNRIYELTLTRQRTLRIGQFTATSPPRLQNTRIFPNILATCRQTHSEATAILYGDNSFSFPNEVAFGLFVRAIGPSIKHVRRLDVVFARPARSEHGDITCLKGAEKLERLIVRVPRGIFPNDVAVALWPLDVELKKKPEGWQLADLMESEQREEILGRLEEFVRDEGKGTVEASVSGDGVSEKVL